MAAGTITDLKNQSFPLPPLFEGGRRFEEASPEIPHGLFSAQNGLHQAYQGSLRTGAPAAKPSPTADLSPAVSLIYLHNYAPELEGLVNPDSFVAYIAKLHWPAFLSDAEKMAFLKKHSPEFEKLTRLRPDLTYGETLSLLADERHFSSLPAQVLMKRPDISFGELDNLMNTIASIVSPINPALVPDIQNEALGLLAYSGTNPDVLLDTYLAIDMNTLDPGQMLAAFSEVASGQIANPTQARDFLDPKPASANAQDGGEIFSLPQPEQNQPEETNPAGSAPAGSASLSAAPSGTGSVTPAASAGATTGSTD